MSTSEVGGKTYHYDDNVTQLKKTGVTPVRLRVPYPIAHALVAEAKRCRKSVEQTAALILQYWYEDVYLPTQREKR